MKEVKKGGASSSSIGYSAARRKGTFYIDCIPEDDLGHDYVEAASPNRGFSNDPRSVSGVYSSRGHGPRRPEDLRYFDQRGRTATRLMMKKMLADLFLTSKVNRPPLKIGIFLDDTSLPRWIEQVIRQIQASNFARIELLVFNAAVEEKLPRRSWWRSILRLLSDPTRRSQWGYQLYIKLDKIFFRQSNDPLDAADCTALLAGIQRISVAPIVRGYTHRFGEAEVERIRRQDLDVIVRFGFNILRGDVLNAARYGIWSFHHGDNDFYRGGPACFWELYEGKRECGVTLQVLSEQLDAGMVLEKATFSISKMPSLIRNRFTPYWGSTTLIIQKLYQLHTLGWDVLKQRSVPSMPFQGKRKLYNSPGNLEASRWMLAVALIVVGKALRRLVIGKQVSRWRIAIRRGKEPLYRGAVALQAASFQWVESPRGHFYADPFVIEVRGRSWIFFEDYLYRESKGVIVCGEVSSEGHLGKCASILSFDYHLSYPFVFDHEGGIYLIPESSAGGTVQLFEATNFPYHWKLRKVLFHGNAVDTTVFVRDGIYWFFTSLGAQAGIGRSLCLFYADSLEGDWQSHPCNPISMDVRYARAAGRIVEREGKIIRMSQDGSRRYGGSINLHEITTLTKTDYREVFLRNVSLDGIPFLGTHTYDRCGDIDVIDGLTQTSLAREMRFGEFLPMHADGRSTVDGKENGSRSQ